VATYRNKPATGPCQPGAQLASSRWLQTGSLNGMSSCLLPRRWERELRRQCRLSWRMANPNSRPIARLLCLWSESFQSRARTASVTNGVDNDAQRPRPTSTIQPVRRTWARPRAKNVATLVVAGIFGNYLDESSTSRALAAATSAARSCAGLDRAHRWHLSVRHPSGSSFDTVLRRLQRQPSDRSRASL